MKVRRLNKYFSYALFPPEVIRQARERLQERSAQAKKKDGVNHLSLESTDGLHEDYDSEDEFFAAYRKGFRHATCEFNSPSGSLRLTAQPFDSTIVGCSDPGTMVDIAAPSRPDALYILDIFEAAAACQFRAKESAPKIFIGHGRNAQWRELKDHLADFHHLEVITYEVGTRAGLSVKEVLETMLVQSSMAFLLLTAEDKDEHGNLHARENVIHELGLFQGRLGFTRAIVLFEEGVTEFSNIQGINQIRFRPGRIRETFGDVLATIKRESS